jgi:hypothetical protein
MLKQGLITTFLTLLFAISPAMADHHNKADEHKGSEHPAHEMGEAVTSDNDAKEQLSEEYKHNLEKAKEMENAPHPAHEMGDEDVLDD